MPRGKKRVDFEASLNQLETLVQQMESEEMPLEESLKAFEQGIKLTRDCQQALEEAELKVEQLLNQSGETQPFEIDTNRGDE